MANKFVLSDFVVKLTADTKQAMKGLTDFETKMDAIAKKMEKSSLGKAVGSKNKQASKQLDKEVKETKKANDTKAKDKQAAVSKSESKIRKELEATAKVQKRIDDIQKGSAKYQDRLKANFKRKRKLDTTSTPAEKGKETKAFNARLRSIQARADKMSEDAALKGLTVNPVNSKASDRANAGVFQQKLKQSHDGFKPSQTSKAMSSYYKREEALAKKADTFKTKLDKAARKAKEKADIASEKAANRRNKTLGLKKQARETRSKDFVTDSAATGAANYKKRLDQVKARIKATKKLEDAARKAKEKADLSAMKAKEKAQKIAEKSRNAKNKAQGLRKQARLNRSKDFVTDSAAIGSANYKKRLDQVRTKLNELRKAKEKADKKSQTILHDHHVKKRYDLEAKQRASDKKLAEAQAKEKEKAHEQALKANSRLDKQRQKAADRIIAQNKSKQHSRDVKHAKAIAENNKFDRNKAAKAAKEQAAALKASARQARAVAAAQERAARASQRIAKNTQNASVSMRKLAAYGLSLYTLADQLKKAFVTGFKIESAEAGMTAIMSTMEDITSRPAELAVSVDIEMQHAEKVAMRFGRTIDTVSDSWMRMIASNRGKMPLDQLRKLQEGVLAYGTVTGMTEDRAKNAFLAINQMMSKGVVQSEELKRQLSEHMPGALGIFAKSVGVSEAELYKMMASGELIASETLPLFAEELIATANAGGALDKKLESTRVTVARLNAALSIARVKFFKGSDKGLSRLAEATKNLLVKLFPWIETLGEVFGSMLTDLANGVDWLTQKIDEINKALGGEGTKEFRENLLSIASVLKTVVYLFASMFALKFVGFIARLFGLAGSIKGAILAIGRISFQGILTSILSGLYTIFGGLKKLIVTGFIVSIRGALISAAKMIPALLGRITLGWAGLIATVLWSVLDTFFPTFTQAIRDFVSGLWSMITGIFSSSGSSTGGSSTASTAQTTGLFGFSSANLRQQVRERAVASNNSNVNITNTVEVGVTGDVNDQNARTLGNSVGDSITGNTLNGYGLDKMEG